MKGMPEMKLKGIRAEWGMNQERVARAIGMTTATYCSKESGEQDFYRREVLKLMLLFGKSYEELFMDLFEMEVGV